MERITFEIREPEGRTKNGLDLYRGQAEVFFTVSNPAFGIAEVRWVLESEGREILDQGTAAFTDPGQAAAAGFQVLEQQGERVLSAGKPLGTDRDSQELMLRVGVRGWSGEESWESIYFAQDQTPPELSLEATGSGDFRRESQRYVLTLRDRNADPVLLSLDGVLPLPLSWQQTEEGYRAEFTLEEEGTYAFRISAGDLAGNPSEGSVGDTFTLDRTPPAVSITEADGSPPDPHSRQLKITVEDRNLRREGIRVTLTGRGKGRIPLNLTEAEEAEDSLSYLTEVFPEDPALDGVYTLQVSCTDSAGNQGEARGVFTLNAGGSRYETEGEAAYLPGAYLPEAADFVLLEENLDRLLEESLEVRLEVNGEERFLENGREYTVQMEEREDCFRYRYRIPARLFREEGVYALEFRSVDEAGNHNNSSRFFGERALSFCVDSVKPLIRCLTPDPEGAAEFLIRDNLLLEKTGFFWNGEPLSPERQEETYRICLPEGEQGELKVLAEDAAGNQTVFVKALEDKDPSPGKWGLPAAAGTSAFLLFLLIKRKIRKRRFT